MSIVSLKQDYCFKKLMANETVRKQFLSDVLGIPPEEIKSVRPANTFLWRMYRRQKQGILDLLLILNDDSKVNIELQIRVQQYWDRRCVFYLAKVFTEALLAGENYTKLKKCINISILDFNWDKGKKYHHVYRLRDEEGKQFTDLLEIHIIELGKKLDGTDRVDDWIRLINAESEEDLKMIKIENAGIREAIREIRQMGAGRTLRAIYEERLKVIRDQNARDDYVMDEGIAIGENMKLLSVVRKKMAKNMSAEEIADLLEEEPELVRKMCDCIQEHPDWGDEKIGSSLVDRIALLRGEGNNT